MARNQSTKSRRGGQLKHGQACRGRKTKEYYTWRNIKERCHNPRHPRYADYGGRGIIVCDRWRYSFEAFAADMGVCPPLHMIEREDNNGPYSPENCYWATATEQNQNRRNNHHLTYQGRTQTLTNWARELGISCPTLSSRLNRQGWSVERALSTAT